MKYVIPVLVTILIAALFGNLAVMAYSVGAFYLIPVLSLAAMCPVMAAYAVFIGFEI